MDEKTDTEPHVDHEEVVLKLDARELNFIRYWAAFVDQTVEEFIQEAACLRCGVFEENVKRANATRQEAEPKEDDTEAADNVVTLKGQKPHATVQ